MKRLLLSLALSTCALATTARAQQHQKGGAPQVQADTVRSLAVSSACDSTTLKDSVDPEMVVCPDPSVTADMLQFDPQGNVDPDIVVDPSGRGVNSEEVRAVKDSTLKGSSMHGREEPQE